MCTSQQISVDLQMYQPQRRSIPKHFIPQKESLCLLRVTARSPSFPAPGSHPSARGLFGVGTVVIAYKQNHSTWSFVMVFFPEPNVFKVHLCLLCISTSLIFFQIIPLYGYTTFYLPVQQVTYALFPP